MKKIANLLFRSNVKEGYVYIPAFVVKEAVELEILKPLAVNNCKARIGGYGNVYLRYRDTNYVLVHIRENLYKVINLYLCTPIGKVNVVQMLSRNCTFCIGNAGIAYCAPRKHLGMSVKTVSLGRMIESIKQTGGIVQLPVGNEVHHKVHRAMETQSALWFGNTQQHRQFHEKNGRDSRKQPIVWHSIHQLDRGMREIRRKDRNAAKRLM